MTRKHVGVPIGLCQHALKVAIATKYEEANASSRLSGLREQWLQKILDLIGGIPPRLPPLREINHHINLIDPGKRITYRLPKCPDALKAELANKVSQYTDVGWWVLAIAQQAVPMVCIPKKSTWLRTVFDLWIQNDNMEKDVSPFPDQDTICNDIACAPTDPSWICW